MKRRDFITLLGGAAASWPLVARAQQKPPIAHVGLVSIGANPTDPVLFRPFLEELRKLGYIDGHNIVLERRFAGGHYEIVSEFVADLVARNIDIIVVTGPREVVAAKQATSTNSDRHDCQSGSDWHGARDQPGTARRQRDWSHDDGFEHLRQAH